MSTFYLVIVKVRGGFTIFYSNFSTYGKRSEDNICSRLPTLGMRNAIGEAFIM